MWSQNSHEQVTHRMIAKVAWHPGGLCPRVGFIVTNAICPRFAANAKRLQLHALAYNLANFRRILVLREKMRPWSLTTPRNRLVKIGDDRDSTRGRVYPANSKPRPASALGSRRHAGSRVELRHPGPCYCRPLTSLVASAIFTTTGPIR